jgi:hypothetical protein
MENTILLWIIFTCFISELASMSSSASISLNMILKKICLKNITRFRKEEIWHI